MPLNVTLNAVTQKVHIKIAYNNTFKIFSKHGTKCNTECRNTAGAY